MKDLWANPWETESECYVTQGCRVRIKWTEIKYQKHLTTSVNHHDDKELTYQHMIYAMRSHLLYLVDTSIIYFNKKSVIYTYIMYLKYLNDIQLDHEYVIFSYLRIHSVELEARKFKTMELVENTSSSR